MSLLTLSPWFYVNFVVRLLTSNPQLTSNHHHEVFEIKAILDAPSSPRMNQAVPLLLNPHLPFKFSYTNISPSLTSTLSQSLYLSPSLPLCLPRYLTKNGRLSLSKSISAHLRAPAFFMQISNSNFLSTTCQSIWSSTIVDDFITLICCKAISSGLTFPLFKAKAS